MSSCPRKSTQTSLRKERNECNFWPHDVMTMQKITVLLADDHTIVRQGFRALLEAEPDIAVVGEAETGRQAVQLAKKLRTDVVLMDIAMPLLNGPAATRQSISAVPSTKR